MTAAPSIPVRPRWREGAEPTFQCCQCAACCRNLKERPGGGWPADYHRLAPMGYYRLPTEEGLQAWDWERRRLKARAGDKGLAVRFAPSLVMVDAAARRVVVLVWELDHVDCPFLEGALCGVYADRPLVCQAFPLLLRSGALAASGKCDSRVEPAEEAPDAFRAAYPDAYPAAERALAAPRRVGAVVAFLEGAGALRPVRGMARGPLLERVREWPAVGLVEAALDAGAMEEPELLSRLRGD